MLSRALVDVWTSDRGGRIPYQLIFWYVPAYQLYQTACFSYVQTVRMFGTSLVRAGVGALICERQTSGSIHSIGKHVDRQFRLHGKDVGSIGPSKERFVSFQRQKSRSTVFLIEPG